MTAPLKTWEVLPHGKLTPIERNRSLTVAGDIRMPVGNMKRRMTVVRMDDRQLVVYGRRPR